MILLQKDNAQQHRAKSNILEGTGQEVQVQT
jgi:hypothetical protein